MPDHGPPKHRLHPFRGSAAEASRQADDAAPPFAELCVTSNFTFLTGASHPEELVQTAAAMGYRAVALTDTNTLAGVVRAHVAAKEAGIRFLPGSRLRFPDVEDCSLLVYPTDGASYRRLCRLLTLGKRRAAKGECHLQLDDLARCAEGLLGVVVPENEQSRDMGDAVCRIRPYFDDDRLSLAVSTLGSPFDTEQLARAAETSRLRGVPLVAINDVHYHTRDRRMLQDVLVCIRNRCTLPQAGFRLSPNSERHLKGPLEMHRLFAACPGAIARTMQIADRCAGFSLDLLRYEYPEEVVPEGKSPIGHLAELVWAGAAKRYPLGISAKVREQIEHELALIAELEYTPYFLTVHDLVEFARSQGILCQGRGAAANSVVCYCLGVTSVNPVEINLLFERFVSRERNEPPDIDIDFEHERREEVIQYIYAKYGRERAALTAEVITYRRRSAVRDVGKALGLSLDLVDRLARDAEWWDEESLNPGRLREMGLNPEEPTMRWLARLASEILGFPRHLSQHVGGFVITRSPLCELVPIENAAMADRTVIEWDKDDVDALGILKIDVLGLGMLTCIRKALDLVNQRREAQLSLATIPSDDRATYEMIQSADTIGVFQIESRAQMSMLPRLRPACFYDLVIEVAIVRPGPIQGDMVHPYLRRRSGGEKPEYPHPLAKEVLGRTLGVPLFQEQCMALAVKIGGFTSGEADQLRRSMAAWKRKGDTIYRFGQKLIDGMTERGIPREFALRCFEQIKGFSEYGFPESHAASFALLVYASSWLKCHYPAQFACAILNSQPMGFYSPAQLVRDAREHGVSVQPVDVHSSSWDCTIEPDGALRLGMRLVNGLGKDDARRIEAAVHAHGPFATMHDLWRRSDARVSTLRKLAAADAFSSMGLSRQSALWHARALRDSHLPLFDHAQSEAAATAGDTYLPSVTQERQVTLDYRATGFSLKAHPVSFERPRLSKQGVKPNSLLRDSVETPDGASITVAGLVLVRQRPGTANDVTFMTVEDETGIANLVVWRRVYNRYRREASSKFILASGRVQRQGEVVHVVVSRIRAATEISGDLVIRPRNFH
jgi:error-prone DNA polymerase